MYKGYNIKPPFFEVGPKHIAYARETNKEEVFWSLNTDAHLRSCLLGRSVTIPFDDSKMELGEFGRVFLLILTRSGQERELSGSRLWDSLKG